MTPWAALAAALLLLACLPKSEEEDKAGDARCSGSKIETCSEAHNGCEWRQTGACKTNQTCQEFPVTDSNGKAYVTALCVNADGTGAYCNTKTDTGRCRQNALQACSAAYGWMVAGQCKTTQTCKEFTVTDDYGKSSIDPRCVNPDGTGEWCNTKVETARCRQNVPQSCSAAHGWSASGQCTTSQTCKETSKVDPYGKAYVEATCVAK